MGQPTAACSGLGGRAGVALLRQVLDELDVRHESDLESELLPLLVRAGWTELVPQHEVWPGSLLVARLDFADPTSRQGFEADGWGVSRFLTHQIRREPMDVVRTAARLRAALERRSA